MSIVEFMTKDHRECDTDFSKVETCVNTGDFAEASAEMGRFYDSMDRHFRMEEEVIFKAFNEVAQDGCNPTHVMILEHNQLRQLLETMKKQIVEKNKKGFFAVADTMMILLQQHNMKEENIMYKLCDDALGVRAEKVLANAQEIKNG